MSSASSTSRHRQTSPNERQLLHAVEADAAYLVGISLCPLQECEIRLKELWIHGPLVHVLAECAEIAKPLQYHILSLSTSSGQGKDDFD